MNKQGGPAPPPQTHHSSPQDTTKRSSGMSLSMHDGVEVWCDCCSCEAEPYWLAAFERQASTADEDGTSTQRMEN